jgi:hypothetical protein
MGIKWVTILNSLPTWLLGGKTAPPALTIVQAGRRSLDPQSLLSGPVVTVTCRAAFVSVLDHE